LALIITQSGKIESIEDKRYLLGKDLVCLINYYNSEDIFDKILSELINSEIFFLEDLKNHLRFLLSQFEDFEELTQNMHRIEISGNKMMIMETAKGIYKYISQVTMKANKGGFGIIFVDLLKKI
jgi:hypothetical protein